MRPQSFLKSWAVAGLLLILSFSPLESVQAANPSVSALEIIQLRTGLASDSAHSRQTVMTVKVTNTSQSQTLASHLELVTTAALPTRTALWDLIKGDYIPATITHPQIVSRQFNLAPGQSTTTNLTFDRNQVTAQNSFGVFGFGAQLHGTSDHTVVPDWSFSNFPELNQTHVTMAVQLSTLSHHRIGESVSPIDSHELERLDLLTSQLAAMSWLQDPMLTQWLSTFSDTDHSSLASAISQRLAEHSDTAFLPFAHVDLSRMAASGMTASIGSALGDRKTYYMSGDAEIDAPTFQALSHYPSLHIITGNSITAGNPLITSSALTTSNKVEYLVNDDGISQCLEMNFASAFLQARCITSQLAMTTSESPSTSRSILVVTPALWEADNELLQELTTTLQSSSAFSLVNLAALTSTPAQDLPRLPVNNVPTKYGNETISLVHEINLASDALSNVYADNNLSADFHTAALVSLCDFWIDDSHTNNFLRAYLSQATKLSDALYIETSAHVSISGAQAQLPITVVNDSNHDAKISVWLQGLNPARLRSNLTQEIVVAAGKRQTIAVPITVPGVGSVPAVARLITSSGDTYGKPVFLTISSNAYLAFARTLVWGAFGLLLVLVLNTLRKRRMRDSD